LSLEEEFHLRVYRNRSELFSINGLVEEFKEGATSTKALERYKLIETNLRAGFLPEVISFCQNHPDQLSDLDISEADQLIIEGIASSVTSETGRALLGLSVLQLCVKAISPDQSIRLHKSGSGGGNFGWVEGISMRSLDKNFITPTLRSAGLLKMNADGFMMTRSFAENYPYSAVYKAAIRGARNDWQQLVEGLETSRIDPLPALKLLISKLLNAADDFRTLADEVLVQIEANFKIGNFSHSNQVTELVVRHLDKSTYAARIMEISMHALLQALEDLGGLGGLELRPLSQMRSANKKHGNIGDIELMDGPTIKIAWDAKYGKTYLRDELEELNDKLASHFDVVHVGFVTSDEPVRGEEIQGRADEISELHGPTVVLETFPHWVNARIEIAKKVGISENEISRSWLRAYAESLAQLRVDRAPIDEPCAIWLQELKELLPAL
jgi:hypothetical protein